MPDHRRGRQPGIKPPRRHRDIWIKRGQPPDMRLVNQGIRPTAPRGCILAPIRPVIDHHRLRHRESRVARIKRQIPPRRADPVAHQGIRPAQPPVIGPRVRVHQQLVRIEPMPVFGRIGAMGAIAVKLPGPHPVDPHMPDVAVAFMKQHPGHFLAAVVREQAQFQKMGIGRKHREIDAADIDRRPQRPRLARRRMHPRQDARQIAFGRLRHPFSSAYKPA